MKVTPVESAEAARSAVDNQEAGVAIIIPADFSEQFSDLAGQATIELYQDPTLTLGPGIVQSILSQFMDGMSGAKIAVNVVLKQTGSSRPAAHRPGHPAIHGRFAKRATDGGTARRSLPVHGQGAGEPAQRHDRPDHGRDDHLLCVLHRSLRGSINPDRG